MKKQFLLSLIFCMGILFSEQKIKAINTKHIGPALMLASILLPFAMNTKLCSRGNPAEDRDYRNIKISSYLLTLGLGICIGKAL